MHHAMSMQGAIPVQEHDGTVVVCPVGALDLAVADEERSVGLIFGETASGRGVEPRTERIALCVVRVPGIPEISVEEALWSCAGMLLGERS